MKNLHIIISNMRRLAIGMMLFAPLFTAAKEKPDSAQIAVNMAVLQERTEPDTARYIALARTTIAMAEESGQTEAVTNCYRQLISYLFTNINAERAYAELTKLRDYTLSNGANTEDLYVCWENIITHFFNESNPLRAMSEFHDMQKVAEEHEDNYGLACAYASLGAISEYAYETGIENFEKALKYLRLAGQTDKEYYIYYRMADLAYCNERYDQVLRYLDMMMQAPDRNEYLELYACPLKILTYWEMRNSEDAAKVYNRAKELWDSGEIPYPFRSQFAMSMAIYLCQWGSLDEAQKLLEYIDVPEEKFQTEIFYYKMLGDYKRALEMTERYDTIQKIRLVEGQRAKVVNANAFYKNKELAAQNLALQFANSQIRVVMLAVVLFFVIAAAAGITITIRRHNKRLRKERDNTEKQRLIAEQQRAIAEQERAIAEQERNKALTLSEMKTAFIQNMSHEVRTPLNSIIGFNDLLNRPDMEFSHEERIEMENAVKTQADALMQLLDNVIFLSRIDTQDIKPKLDTYALCEIFSEAFMKIEGKIKRGVAINIDSAAQTGITLTTDQNLLGAAITNVLDNAAKFTSQGQISVEITQDDESGKITIAITDTGDGIQPQDTERVFDRFEKLGRYDAGFGLGLSIARESLALIGGTIHLDTTITNATRFVIELNNSGK